jgi:drug/metabolite transporter (DMT)-like permease
MISDWLTTAFGFGFGTMLVFLGLCKARKADIMKVIREKRGWAMLCGLADANTMFAQFIAVIYLPVVIVMCIKRGGIVLTVVFGWLIFKEQNIADRMIASLAMVGGIAIFYLPLSLPQALALAVVAMAGVVVALRLTRNKGGESACAESVSEEN